MVDTCIYRMQQIRRFYISQDLVSEDVMLLDTFDQVFVWIGRGANEVEKKEGLQTAQVSLVILRENIYME